MAPSARSAGTRARKAQNTLLGYSKVTKATKIASTTKPGKGIKDNAVKVGYLVKSIEPVSPTKSTPNPRKRARDDEGDSQAEETDTEQLPCGKRVQLSSQWP
jgi:hypothetical protein